jgi:biotin carboxyl carrier protein
MNIPVEVDGKRFEIDLADPSVSVIEVEPGIYSVMKDGRSFQARVEQTADGIAVTVGTRRFEVEVIDPRRLRRKGGAGRREGRQNIIAPMPGKVVRVLVAEGDEVAAGQGIAVIEAMKMQNELKAAKAGRVVSVGAREGGTVAAGETLAVIE